MATATAGIRPGVGRLVEEARGSSTSSILGEAIAIGSLYAIANAQLGLAAAPFVGDGRLIMCASREARQHRVSSRPAAGVLATMSPLCCCDFGIVAARVPCTNTFAAQSHSVDVSGADSTCGCSSPGLVDLVRGLCARGSTGVKPGVNRTTNTECRHASVGMFRRGPTLDARKGVSMRQWRKMRGTTYGGLNHSSFAESANIH